MHTKAVEELGSQPQVCPTGVSRDDFDKYWSGEMDDAEAKRFVEHAMKCPTCLNEWKLRRALDEFPSELWNLAMIEVIRRDEMTGHGAEPQGADVFGGSTGVSRP